MSERTYFGYLVRQRIQSDTVPFFVFSARAQDVRGWTGIKRIEDIPQGTQRRLRESRVRAIARFLKANPVNTIPNSILLAFTPNTATFTSLDQTLSNQVPNLDMHNNCEAQIEWGVIRFEFEPDQEDYLRPALIVDGQHRLYGMSNFDQENLPVLIVGLIDAPLQEQAFQFIVINNKAIRVPTDNAKSIIAEIDEEALQKRLLEAGVSYGNMSPILRDLDDLPTSPFQHLLDWPHNRGGTRLISLTAIEQSLRYVQTGFDFLGEDEDSLFGLFCSIWKAVKAKYPDLWGQDNQLMTKVSVNALNEFLVDRLKYAWEMGYVDVTSPEAVEEYLLENLLELIPSVFWQNKWNIIIQDNANVRRLIKDDLATLLQNSRLARNWTTGLEIVEDSSD